MNTVLQATLEILMVVAITTIPVFAKMLTNFVGMKVATLKLKTKTENEERLLESINATIEDSVNYVSQTFVDALKKSGEFNVENQRAAMAMAVDKVKENLSEEAQEFIMANFNDMTNWITTKIEATIKVNK